MSRTEVIYLKPIETILTLLERLCAQGLTERRIEGLGRQHQLHKASLLGFSASLPIVIEFFDSHQLERILGELKSWVKPENIVSWTAQSGI